MFVCLHQVVLVVEEEQDGLLVSEAVAITAPLTLALLKEGATWYLKQLVQHGGHLPSILSSYPTRTY